MNRKERRRQDRFDRKLTPAIDDFKQKAIERIHKTVENDVQTMLDEAKLTSTKQACEVMTSVFAMALNNEYGFGTQRINKLIQRVRLQLECISGGLVTAADIRHWCFENKINL